MFSLSRHGVLSHLSLSSTTSALRSSVVRVRRPRQHARTYATIPPTSLKPTHSIYVSNSTDPYFNLTFEDWYVPLFPISIESLTSSRLFRFYPPNAPLLLLYRDAPCVVIGRNQNPWKEVNIAASESRGIPWIRRRSGGGTVYHVRLDLGLFVNKAVYALSSEQQDLGNTNYSIHVPRATFDRTATANIVVRAIRALSVDAYVNGRNDICVSGEKMSLLDFGFLYFAQARAQRFFSCMSTSQARRTRLRIIVRITTERCSFRRGWIPLATCCALIKWVGVPSVVH